MTCDEASVRRSPGVTVVIPVHQGREEALLRLLRTIAEASRSSFYPTEVLIISRDLADLDRRLRALSEAFPIPIRTAFFPQARTLAELRNAGLRAVTTEWVHFLDSDTFLPPDYFVRLERALDARDRSAAFVQLDFAPAPSDSALARYEAEIDRWATGRYITESRVCGLNGMGLLARTEAMRSVGGFDPHLVAAEDIELGYRLFRAGIPVVFLPGIFVYHVYPTRLRDLLRRKFWHGQGYGLLLRRHPEFWREITRGRRPSVSAAFRRPRFLAYVLLSHVVFLAGLGLAWMRAQRVSEQSSSGDLGTAWRSLPALEDEPAESPTFGSPSGTPRDLAPGRSPDAAKRERG